MKNTKTIASIMLGALDGLLIQWIMNQELYKMREATELLVKTMIKGLRSEK